MTILLNWSPDYMYNCMPERILANKNEYIYITYRPTIYVHNINLLNGFYLFYDF